MDEAVVTTKGRVVIPAKLRRKLGIKPGTHMKFDEKNGAMIIRPITEAYVDSIQGILKRKPGGKAVTQGLLEDRAEDFRCDKPRGRSVTDEKLTTEDSKDAEVLTTDYSDEHG